MNTRHKSAIRLSAAVLLSTLSFSVSAQITPPSWQPNSEWSVYQYLEAGSTNNPESSYTGTAFTSPLSSSVTNLTGGQSTVNGKVSFGQSGGTYSIAVDSNSVSTGGDQDADSGYFLSEAGMNAYFVTPGDKLYVSYSVTGTVSLDGTVLPDPYNSYWAYAYNSFVAGFFIENQSVPVEQRYSTEQKFDWIQVYEELAAPGSISHSYSESGTTVVSGLIPNDTYRFSFDGYVDGFSSGTSNAGAPWSVTFSVSTTAPVPEPSEGAMLVLGLAGLAGWLRRRRPM